MAWLNTETMFTGIRQSGLIVSIGILIALDNEVFAHTKEVASSLRDIADALATPPKAVGELPKLLQVLYTWQGYVIALVGIPLGIFLAGWQAKKSIDTHKKLQELEQKGLLRALRGELSGVLYNLFYLSENIGEKEPGLLSYSISSNRRYRQFPTQFDIYASTAGRAGLLTGRAFGMLSTYYTKCGETATRFCEAVEAGSVPAELKDALHFESGHGVLIRYALQKFEEESDLNIRLYEVSDSELRGSLDGFTPSERAFFIESARIWKNEFVRRSASAIEDA